MTISLLSGIGGFAQSQNINNVSNKLQAALSNLLGQNDATDVSPASQLQSQTAALKQISNNLAQASSLTQVAGGGIEQIASALSQLQSLAQQASSSALTPSNSAALNEQFTHIVGTIDQIVAGTTFNGQPLLGGAFSGSGALSLDTVLGTGSSGSDTLNIGNLGSSSLLAGVGNITSPANATQALGVITNALNQVSGTGAAIGSFQQTLGFALAGIDTAVLNQQAANASLSETDLATASTQTSQDQVLQAASIALAAQGNNLSPALLKLVG